MRIALLPSLALVILVACSDSAQPTPTPDAGDDAAVDAAADTGSPIAATVLVNNYTYKPSKVTVKVGDTVRWTFTNGTHAVTSGSSCTLDANPELDSGEHGSPFTYEHTFTKAGTYPYYCTYMKHCVDFGQVGTVTVTP